jgi:hypothetical protein
MAMRPIRGYHAPDRYPSREYQLRHIHRNRDKNGLAPAFARVGQRVLFDPDKLDALLAAQTRDEPVA